MNEATNEQLDRYLFGEMNTAEQQFFLDEAARNPELGRTVATEQQIEHTLRADRDAAPSNHAMTRQKMLALAAATPVADGAATSSTPATNSSGWLGKMIAGSVAAVAVVGGIIWLATANTQQTETPAAVQPAPPQPATALPQLQQPPSQQSSQQSAEQSSQLPQTVGNQPPPAVNFEKPSSSGRTTAAEPSSRARSSSAEESAAKRDGSRSKQPTLQIHQGADRKKPNSDIMDPIQKPK
ncbi:MAG: hypothetical protein IT211_15100 [Armatimonadetes bacterium]|nr:hypothetical protein [Armatimonadota bacterium]